MRKNEPPLLPHERWLRAGIVAGFLIALAFLVLVAPKTILFFKLPCGFHTMTGLPCPLCGVTRATRALLHGNFHRALYLNAAALPILLALLGIIGISLIEAGRGWRLVSWKSIGHKFSRFTPLLILLIIAWWIPHLVIALRTPKPELVNLKHPIAAKLRSTFCRGGL